MKLPHADRSQANTGARRRPLPASIFGAFALGAIVVYGMSSGVRSEVVILIYVYALLGAGLYVPLVLTDQVSLAYGAYFGIGAYTFAIASARGFFDPTLAIPLGMLIAATLAGIVAIAMSRLAGYFLAVATMLLALVFSRVLLEASDLTGGPTGLTFEPVLLGHRITRVELLIGAGILVWLVMHALENLRRSRLGDALRLMSHSAPAAESVGLHTRWARVVSLCVGAGVASLAGSVFALSQGFVLPESFGLEIAFLILFMPIIGGVQSPWGCLIGATLVALVLLIAPDFGPGRLLFGLLVLGIVLVFPGGILAASRALARVVLKRARPGATGAEPEAEANIVPTGWTPAQAAKPPSAASGRELLHVDNVSKRFGGIQALRSVSFEVGEGEVLGIVGPNGAGKSTLVDVITGLQTADSGRVVLDGVDLRERTAARAASGMARTFQHPLLAPALSIRDNVELGRASAGVSKTGLAMFAWFTSSMLRGRGHDCTSNEALGAPRGAGIEARVAALLAQNWGAAASEVSYAVEKIAEIGRALIASPRVLIMDEPFAGLDRESVRTVWDVFLRSRSERLGTIVVDHNVDLLRDICDRIVVMDQGAVIAQGAPAAVLLRPEVRRAYFGEADG